MYSLSLAADDNAALYTEARNAMAASLGQPAAPIRASSRRAIVSLRQWRKWSVCCLTGKVSGRWKWPYACTKGTAMV